MDADFARDKNVEKCSFVRNREMNCLFVSRISKKRRCFLLIYRTFFNIERPSNLLNVKSRSVRNIFKTARASFLREISFRIH